MFNVRAPCSAYRDHVESHRMLARAIATRENPGSTPNLLLLSGIHRLARRSSGSSDATLHLDEYQRLIVHRDQVDLRSSSAEIPREDSISLAFQVAFRELLALLANRNSRLLSGRFGSACKAELPQQIGEPLRDRRRPHHLICVMLALRDDADQ